MAVNYNRLWKILIDRKMKKKDLSKAADLTQHTMLCLSRNENVTTGVLARICKALNCGFDDIMEIAEDEVSRK